MLMGDMLIESKNLIILIFLMNFMQPRQRCALSKTNSIYSCYFFSLLTACCLFFLPGITNSPTLITSLEPCKRRVTASVLAIGLPKSVVISICTYIIPWLLRTNEGIYLNKRTKRTSPQHIYRKVGEVCRPVFFWAVIFKPNALLHIDSSICLVRCRRVWPKYAQGLRRLGI